MFPEANLNHFAHFYSDHCPILLETIEELHQPLGTRPFHFVAIWLEHGDFKQLVEKNWDSQRASDGSG